MNKKELALKVGEKTGLDKKGAVELVDVVFATALEGLVEDGKVDLGVLGKLEKVEKPARKGVNPSKLKELKEQGLSAEEARAQAEIQIDAKNAPKYKPSKATKDALNA